MRTIKLAEVAGLLQDYLGVIGDDDKLELALRLSPVAYGRLPEPNVVLIHADGHRTELRVEPQHLFMHDDMAIATTSISSIYRTILCALRQEGNAELQGTWSPQNGWVVLTIEGIRDIVAAFRPKL